MKKLAGAFVVVLLTTTVVALGRNQDAANAGPFDAEYAVDVEPHGVVLLRLDQ